MAKEMFKSLLDFEDLTLTNGKLQIVKMALNGWICENQNDEIKW